MQFLLGKTRFVHDTETTPCGRLWEDYNMWWIICTLCLIINQVNIWWECYGYSTPAFVVYRWLAEERRCLSSPVVRAYPTLLPKYNLKNQHAVAGFVLQLYLSNWCVLINSAVSVLCQFLSIYLSFSESLEIWPYNEHHSPSQLYMAQKRQTGFHHSVTYFVSLSAFP